MGLGIVFAFLGASLAIPARADRPDGPDSDPLKEAVSRCGVPEPGNETRLSVRRSLLARTPLTRAAGSVTIPVYFHVLKSTATNGDIPDAVIQQQIDVLNAAYSGATGGANTPFRFVLAPGGIDRTINTLWFNMALDSAQEQAAKTALRRGGPEALNLYSARTTGPDNPLAAPIGPGGHDGTFLLAGFSTFPWEYAGAPWRDGVMILYTTVPGGGQPNYGDGKTAVHEVGHWLGLLHTFTGGCTEPNDEVSDTPQEASPYLGCGSVPDTCPSNPGADPIHNYMDYSYDPCMWDLTSGQSARMDAMHLQYRSPTLTLSPVVVPGGQPSTGTITLTAAAGTETVFTLLSAAPSQVIVPATARVPAGAISVSFPIGTVAFQGGVIVIVGISATNNGMTLYNELRVKPMPRASRIVLPRGTIVGGGGLAAAVEIDQPAPAGGVSVALSSSNPSAASVPSSVVVPAGATSATFTISTSVVATSTAVTLTVTTGGGSTSATLTVLAPSVSIAWVKPAELTWGPAGTLTAAGYAQNGAGGVQMSWRDVTLNGGWNAVAWQPLPDSFGQWSNTIPASNNCHVYAVSVTYAGASTGFTYDGAHAGFCGIQVRAGTYGANCTGTYGNATWSLAPSCNNLSSCSYAVRYQTLGDPSPFCAKDFRAEWKCGIDPTVRTAVAPAEAGFGSVVHLSCP